MSNTRTAKSKPPQDIDAILAAAALPERIVALCLRGDLLADWEAAHAALDVVRADASGRLAAGPEQVEAEARIAAIEEQMRDAVLSFRIRAMGRPEFDAAMVANPPRPGVDRDKTHGYNVDALDREMVRKGVVSPVLTEAQWDALESKLTPHQFGMLVNAAVNVTLNPVSVPFSLAALLNSPGSGVS